MVRSASTAPPVVLEPARDAAAYDAARQLFKRYAAWLGVDLSFQGFEHELSSLPGRYAPPRGELLIAWSSEPSSTAVGCVAVRPLDALALQGAPSGSACEMKRLWVAPELRGSGLGMTLGSRILQVARELGYGRMYLDTLSTMHAANALYAKLGFLPVPAYYPNPEPTAVYYARDL